MCSIRGIMGFLFKKSEFVSSHGTTEAKAEIGTNEDISQGLLFQVASNDLSAHSPAPPPSISHTLFTLLIPITVQLNLRETEEFVQLHLLPHVFLYTTKICFFFSIFILFPIPQMTKSMIHMLW